MYLSLGVVHNFSYRADDDLKGDRRIMVLQCYTVQTYNQGRHSNPQHMKDMAI